MHEVCGLGPPFKNLDYAYARIQEIFTFGNFRLQPMFPLIFCALCVEILASAHFFWKFTQIFVFQIQSDFRVQN